jgi:hypothetical protein
MFDDAEKKPRGNVKAVKYLKRAIEFTKIFASIGLTI